MPDEVSLFPLEFFVCGTPASSQAKGNSKPRWKATVKAVAMNRVRELVDVPWPDERPLGIAIYYFPSAPMQGDIDNIVKPIMDALIGAAYSNDRLVESVLVRKFEPNSDWSFSQPSDMLAAALDAEAPVVYIRLDDTMSWRRN